ncbi:MAG: homocysteine S-methyltransferase family protein, partial [Bacteroidia bacterium]|nr:homocysteine S-methyltransferase family protein [Bacteroidia bacterium]
APRYISGLIRSLKSVLTNKKIVVYPNSGEVFNAQNKTWSGISDPNTYVHMVKEWIELGADIIGGCCRIGPEHVRSVKGIVYPL